MTTRLKRVSISGFKSIRLLKEFDFGKITVLLGANGAGKSNFISFFQMLSFMITYEGLQTYVGKAGGASKLLFDGPSVTREITGAINIETTAGQNEYVIWLAHAGGDSLIFTEEKLRFSKNVYATKASWTELGAGHNNSRLIDTTIANKTVKSTLALLRQLVVFQFHNTSQIAWVRQKSKISDGKYLKADGGNLSAFLYNMREKSGRCYAKIEKLARLALPFFSEFVLEDDYDYVLLQWREKGSSAIFDASQASDGMLRFLLLISLLSQPEDRIPPIIFIDEPELGLHPYAISLLSDLIHDTAERSQIVLSTQSGMLVDHFSPEDIVVVNRRDRESTFKRLSSEEYADWLEDTSISELWERNVFGGGPLL